jgi:hypothetical protein
MHAVAPSHRMNHQHFHTLDRVPPLTDVLGCEKSTHLSVCHYRCIGRFYGILRASRTASSGVSNCTRQNLRSLDQECACHMPHMAHPNMLLQQ